MSVQIHSDGPQGGSITIQNGGNEDQPAPIEKDKLGFKPYVEAVFSYLKNPDTKAPFTLSIEGDWGAGKSSFMYQLEQSLVADKQCTIRFNAWRHDKVESMWAAFALHFIRELMRKLSPLARLRAGMQLRWKRFDGSKGWYPLIKTALLLIIYAVIVIRLVSHVSLTSNDFFLKDDKVNVALILGYLGGTGILLGLIFFLGKIAEVIGNPFKTDLQKFIVSPNYEGNVAFIEEFHRDFRQTLEVLACHHDKIFVFIDDLDRAEVPKAAELMQGLNMMISDSPKLIFIIGMDREKVAAGIAAKYRDLLPFLNPSQQALTTEIGLMQARDFGYKFMEKFVQLSFQIPKASPAFTSLFINSLSGAAPEVNTTNTTVHYNPVLTVTDGEDNKQFREVTLLLAYFFEHNPRRIKQFVNAFRLKAHIANSTGLFNDSDRSEYTTLSIPQIGKFIAMSMIWPELIDELILNHQLLNQLITDTLPGSESRWKSNKLFMDLLHLRPEYDEGYNDIYSMEHLDIWPLIETSPSFKPDPNIRTEENTPAGESSMPPPSEPYEERAYENYNPPNRNRNYGESAFSSESGDVNRSNRYAESPIAPEPPQTERPVP